MASGQPWQKKQKSDEDNIFVTFRENRELLEVLQNAMHSIEQSMFGYGVYLLKIRVCDAAFPKLFVKATCACQEFHKHDQGDYPVGYGISSIFENGFKVLEEYICSTESLTLKKGEKLALAKLLQFLEDSNKDAERALTALLNIPKGVTETEWTMRLAHHLLSKLSVSPTYKLDIISQSKGRDMKCSCGCSEMISGTYGDTSIGIPRGWHGRLDILMNDVPVHVTSIASTDSDLPVHGDCSSLEENATADIMASCREQIRAQTIVFSFWQQKVHPELDSFLIPNIAISKEKIAFCFYDSENDMLLETPLFDLFANSFLNIPSVVVLWLVLNFKFFCSGLSEEIKNTGFKADFFKILGANVEKYKHDISAPCDFIMEKWPQLRRIKQTRKKKDSPEKVT